MEPSRTHQIAQHHAEAVIEWHRDAQPGAAVQLHDLADEKAIAEDVVVTERGSPRGTDGAGGELDVNRIDELYICLT